MQTPKSPITNGETRHIETIPAQQLIERWKNDFGIDISEELKSTEVIDRFECLETKYRFFLPETVAGSGHFYSQLERFPWYYMPHKWEHEMALKDIPGGAKVLEVGCGRGGFVQTLFDRGFAVEGIELNQTAVLQAQKLGLPVTQTSLEDVAKKFDAGFDVVCHFQVLEHVNRPMEFLKGCLSCLRPGGLLLIAVPNMNSFESLGGNLLNQPPHHMGQWYRETFQKLSRFLPMDLIRIEFEPLAEYHIDNYVWYRAGTLPKIKGVTHRIREPFSRFLKKALKRPWIRKKITGHTQYVTFRKH